MPRFRPAHLKIRASYVRDGAHNHSYARDDPGKYVYGPPRHLSGRVTDEEAAALYRASSARASATKRARRVPVTLAGPKFED